MSTLICGVDLEHPHHWQQFVVAHTRRKGKRRKNLISIWYQCAKSSQKYSPAWQTWRDLCVATLWRSADAWLSLKELKSVTFLSLRAMPFDLSANIYKRIDLQLSHRCTPIYSNRDLNICFKTPSKSSPPNVACFRMGGGQSHRELKPHRINRLRLRFKFHVFS